MIENNFNSIFNLTYTSGNRTINHKFEEEYLGDILFNIEDFLRGCGFVFEGTLQIVNEESISIRTPYEDPMFDYDEDFFKMFEEYDKENDVMSWTADQIVKSTEPENTICSICKLDSATMQGHTCYDSNCPRKISER